MQHKQRDNIGDVNGIIVKQVSVGPDVRTLPANGKRALATGRRVLTGYGGRTRRLAERALQVAALRCMYEIQTDVSESPSG